ncbi:MAG: cupin domain-containing protein [bacterium]|nr:cupin domain-containing protein [bacterium]
MTKIKKPWGSELWFVHNENYLGKLIKVQKGKKLSKQYHNKKEETFFAIKGKFILEVNNKEILMEPYRAYTIKPKDIHRVYAKFENVEIIEVSTPQADDIVRVEDDYDRA